MTEIVWCCRIRPSSRQTLTFGCWQRAAAAPWSPAGWWRTGDARRHRLPTSPSTPVEKIQIKTQRWMLSGCRENFTLHLCIREKPAEMTRPRNLNRMQQQKTNWPSGSPPAWRLWWSRWWIWWKLSTQSKQRCYSDVCKRQSILEQLVLTDNREDESVGEVLIQREFHYVSPKLQEASGLRQADENVDVN